jgi:hypothetical protein
VALERGGRLGVAAERSTARARRVARDGYAPAAGRAARAARLGRRLLAAPERAREQRQQRRNLPARLDNRDGAAPLACELQQRRHKALEERLERGALARRARREPRGDGRAPAEVALREVDHARARDGRGRGVAQVL